MKRVASANGPVTETRRFPLQKILYLQTFIMEARVGIGQISPPLPKRPDFIGYSSINGFIRTYLF